MHTNDPMRFVYLSCSVLPTYVMIQLNLPSEIGSSPCGQVLVFMDFLLVKVFLEGLSAKYRLVSYIPVTKPLSAGVRSSVDKKSTSCPCTDGCHVP